MADMTVTVHLRTRGMWLFRFWKFMAGLPGVHRVRRLRFANRALEALHIETRVGRDPWKEAGHFTFTDDRIDRLTQQHPAPPSKKS